MSTFDFLWQLVANHGGVAEFYKAELARVWADKFVNYNPVKAVRENAPKAKPPQVLSFAEYYKQYGTTEESGGWVRKYLPEKQTTIYVKKL